MKFMLLKTYSAAKYCDVPMSEWAPDEIAAHIDFRGYSDRWRDSAPWVCIEGVKLGLAGRVLVAVRTRHVLLEPCLTMLPVNVHGHHAGDCATYERDIDVGIFLEPGLHIVFRGNAALVFFPRRDCRPLPFWLDRNDALSSPDHFESHI